MAVSLIRGLSGPGLNASAGLFLAPVAGEIGVGIGQLSLYLSISSIATIFWLPVAGSLMNKYSIKAVAVLGIALQAIPFFLLGFMNSVWAWYIFAIPLAMGAVILVNLLGPVMINRWFSAKQGVVMGLMMTITSLLGAVFQPLLANLVANSGWRNTYKMFGAIAFIAVIIIAVLLLKNSPKAAGLAPYTDQENAAGVNGKEAKDMAQAVNSEQATGISAAVAKKSSAFYLLILFMFCFTGFVTFSQHIPTFGTTSGLSTESLSIALSLAMIGSAIGSVVIGFFTDKIGIVPTSLGVLAVGVVAMIMFLFSGTNGMMFTAATFTHGFTLSAVGVMAPILTQTFFGQKDYEKLLSLVTMGAPIASVVLMPGYGFMYDITGNYSLVIWSIIGLLAIGAVSLVVGLKKSRELV